MASVVSMENDSPLPKSSSMRLSINRPASIATPSGLKGDNPFAISSALTNSLMRRDLGSIVFDAVVLPAHYILLLYINALLP